MLEKAVALTLFVFSAVYVHAALGLSFGTLSAPRAGFVPLIAGLGALVLTGVNLLRSLIAALVPLPETDLRKALIFILAMVGYVVALPFAGFAATTFLGTFVLLKVSGEAGWLRPGLVSAVASLFLWVGFAKFLLLQLP